MCISFFLQFPAPGNFFEIQTKFGTPRVSCDAGD
nr:MAG TPA: hypothetical protein [Inoviridae sp.]